MSVNKIEFAVNMTCESCVEKVKNCLNGVIGINKFDISLKDQSVIVESTLPSSEIKERLETSGCRTVLKGFGGIDNLGAAVAMLEGEPFVKGVVRFVQINDNTCVVDGTIDGLSPGVHGLCIHEYGDISEGCASVGEIFNPNCSQNESNRYTGDLGKIASNLEGRASFYLEDKIVKVGDIIGRSVVLTKPLDDLRKGIEEISLVDSSTMKRVACGIVARSAGMFENPKRICACDGVTLWDETDKSISGSSRSQL